MTPFYTHHLRNKNHPRGHKTPKATTFLTKPIMATTFSSLFLLCFSLLSSSSFLLPCYCDCKANKLKDGASKVKGMFVFGSSLVDNGNNNFLQNTISKADYFPYGIDFPLGPSGRFTNGMNVIDLLGHQLQLPSFIPAFANPSTKGTRILHGVDYASGGSGIMDDTGLVAGQVITLNEQIKKFEEVTLPDLEAQLGCSSLESLSNYLFLLGTGGNDFSFNYFFTSTNVSLHVFTANLITSLTRQLKTLYGLGGRKFVLMSVNPLGCYPMARPFRKGCVQELNRAAHHFNEQLKMLVDTIKPQMPGSNLVFVNSYKIIRDIIKDPVLKGFTDASNPCCEVGSTGMLCKRGGQVCKDRSGHVYFDGLHPTEAVNVVIATKAYASLNKNEVYPFNVKHLAML